MGENRSHPAPYGSAHDLPSVVEMRETIRGMKLLTRVIGRDQRRNLIELESEMTLLFDLIDRFYEVLGARHWIFTEHLPVSEVEALLASGAIDDAAEAGLIEIIAGRLRGPYWQMGLLGHEAMRARRHNLERARQHYLDEQWDSCALLLLTVLDGFVNDVDPAQRRGLHAREPHEMVAWDSLVGHHKGLIAVMPIFLKPCKRRQDAEVFEVHRHGIVHGTVVNYNNQIVASKAWNMLSAVVDWAVAKQKGAVPAVPKPTLRGTFRLLVEHAERTRYRETFDPWATGADEPRFAELDVVQQAEAFLTSWQAKRWGLVAEALPASLLSHMSTRGKRALRAKQIYEHSELRHFEIAGVSFPQASVAVIHGAATIGDKTGPLEIRWLYEGSDHGLAKEGDERARWVLAVYPPHTFIKDEVA